MRKNLVFALGITALLGLNSFAETPKFSLGATGGVLINEGITGARHESRRYVVGPSVEARFTDHFGLEFNALYRRLGTTSTFNGSDQTIVNRNRGNSWEFPLLGKFYFSGQDKKIQPFVSTGWAFRKIWNDGDVTTLGPGDATSRDRITGSSDTGVGAVFGGGVRVGQGRVSLSPEFRYTRWGAQSGFPTGRNQVDFLLGVRF